MQTMSRDFTTAEINMTELLRSVDGQMAAMTMETIEYFADLKQKSEAIAHLIVQSSQILTQ